jgi:hypothetical protein
MHSMQQHAIALHLWVAGDPLLGYNHKIKHNQFKTVLQTMGIKTYLSIVCGCTNCMCIYWAYRVKFNWFWI